MKKLIVLAFLGLFATASFAQITWNVKAGMNISSYLNDKDADPKIGYRIGGGFEYAFSEIWSIQPSLFFTNKGAKGSSEGIKVTINQNYVELPIMGAARITFNNGLNLVLSAGPYFAYGVGGKVKSGGIKWDTFDGYRGLLKVKKFDAGIGTGAGLEINKIILSLDFQFGLTDLLDGDDTKNYNCAIGVGYRF